MGFKNIFKAIIERLSTPLQNAKRNGMTVGENVTVMGGCNFGSEPYLITIKDNVRISGKVTFLTHDGGTYAFRYKEEYVNVSKFGKIVVDEHTFIGFGSIIMPNVYIGKNCVIGAGSVVTKSVPDGCVVAGVPAKVICTTEEYAKRIFPKQLQRNGTFFLFHTK